MVITKASVEQSKQLLSLRRMVTWHGQCQFDHKSFTSALDIWYSVALEKVKGSFFHTFLYLVSDRPHPLELLFILNNRFHQKKSHLNHCLLYFYWIVTSFSKYRSWNYPLANLHLQIHLFDKFILYPSYLLTWNPGFTIFPCPNTIHSLILF